jgi:hypothetical protein
LARGARARPLRRGSEAAYHRRALQACASAATPPGQRWSGEFSGRAALPVGVPIRVVLGRFVAVGPAPSELFGGFLCISERLIRLS